MNRFDRIEAEVSKTLDTLTNIKRVRANAYLPDKVMRRLTERNEERLNFAPRTYRLAFVALFVLIVVNVFSLVEIRSRTEAQQSVSTSLSNPIQGLATEYQLTANGYQY